MMALKYVCLALLMLYLSGDAMANTDCMKTPWSDKCTPECVVREWVVLKNCSDKNLRAAGDFTEYPDMFGVEFHAIKNVFAYAFRGYKADDLYLVDAVAMIESDAFNGSTFSSISIRNNKNLETLPSAVFRGVTGLENLFIVGNGINSLPGSLFKGLYGLKDLTLIEPSLSCLASGFFSYLEELKVLQLIDTDDTYELKNQEKEIQGFCAQSFKGRSFELKYKFAVDKCAIDCSSKIVFENFIDATKMCDCNSDDGCLDSSCKAITMDGEKDGMDGEKDGMDGEKDGDDDDIDSGSPGLNPGIGYLMTFVASAIFWIVVGFQV